MLKIGSPGKTLPFISRHNYTKKTARLFPSHCHHTRSYKGAKIWPGFFPQVLERSTAFLNFDTAAYRHHRHHCVRITHIKKHQIKARKHISVNHPRHFVSIFSKLRISRLKCFIKLNIYYVKKTGGVEERTIGKGEL